MKLVYQYITIFLTFSPTSNHFRLLQVENSDSKSRLLVDEDDNDQFWFERVKYASVGMRCSVRSAYECK